MSRRERPGRFLIAFAAAAFVVGIAGSRMAAAETITITFANWAAAEGTT
jgi:hypothetical protein